MTALINHPALKQPVRLNRSPRAKRMSLKVDATKRMATLTLPDSVSQRVGLAFLENHLDWLRERLAALPEKIDFAPGQLIPLQAIPHRLEPSVARRGVWAEDGRILVSGRPDFFARRVSDFLKAEAKRQILLCALPMAEQIGRKIETIRVGDPKSRWGSCNRSGKLAFSWRLILAPPEVLSYVVAHEVAHLREMNHSAKFWSWVAALQQDCETPRRWLKLHGAGLYRYGA